MLPKDLLEVEKRKPTIRPKYREVGEYRSVAGDVIDVYTSGADDGWTRGQVEDAIAELETHDTFKFVRSLSTLLEREANYQQHTTISPVELRMAVFEQGFVTNAKERMQVIEAIAATYDIPPAEVVHGLWADREQNEVLVSAPETAPADLIRQYNLSLTQTLVFDAVELEFAVSGNFQEIFGLMKYLGLMYRVDENVTVNVTGPAALFKRTRKYGTTMAKLLPSIMKADEWRMTAQVATEVSGETRIYEFSIDQDRASLFPARTVNESFDSEVERDFATRIDALLDGWTIKREPTILRAGNRVMIPDFSFERQPTHAGGESETAFYLEVIGFWTPDYLEEKLEKVQQIESEYPVMLAVNSSLKCTRDDFTNPTVDHVFFYESTIPVKPVLSRLNAIDDRQVEHDLEKLAASEFEAPTDEVTAISDLASQQRVLPAAIRRYLEQSPGVISNDRYVPVSVLDTIKAEVAVLDEPTLADVTPILERYGVAQRVLEATGYTIHFTSLNQDDATIRPQASDNQ